MKKTIEITIVLIFFSFLTGFQQSTLPATGGGGHGDVAGHDGIVSEVIAVEGYTYVELDSRGDKEWIAAPKFKVEKGDRVLAGKGIEMRDFYSRFLNRTFPVVYFVGTIEVVGREKVASAPQEKAEWKKVETAETPVMGSIKKAEGGYSLEEIMDRKKELADKDVILRGRVVKASGNIMGKLWYHVQDGTGGDAAIDMIVTTQDKADTGDVVLVKGKLGLDRDFGSGYRYDVIIEEATLKVE